MELTDAIQACLSYHRVRSQGVGLVRRNRGYDIPEGLLRTSGNTHEETKSCLSAGNNRQLRPVKELFPANQMEHIF